MSKIFSSISALLVAATCLVGCSSGQNNSAERDPEYMKIIGDIKWTDNLRTWEARLPNCPTKDINSKESGVDYQYFPTKEYRYDNDFLKENCSISIGGINMMIIHADINTLGTNERGVELGLNSFLNTLKLRTTENEGYRLQAILRKKYNPCKTGFREAVCSKYTKYQFRSLDETWVSPTNLGFQLLEEKEEEVYESRMNIQQDDLSDF